ncbi:hypothetical protein RUM43_010777 [Polyplax serrata]|uniref:PRKC apoptosis WT1 regulator protein n=1 Tax=Polyplax serrata TaxID=468196 RepID=A0AAN8P4Q7_POLSC
MASSSVSQEDLENDFELTSRRSRIRTARARTVNPSRMESNGDTTEEAICIPKTSDTLNLATCGQEHDASPKPMSRSKDKRINRCVPVRQPLTDHINRANHLSKGKQQRDRRKLREKRRSTGVVHLQSTESTGGSTGEDEDDILLTSAETKQNTQHNENIDRDLVEDLGLPKSYHQRHNKSPSDLDADDEDNQNQSDSTVSSLVQVAEQPTRPRPNTPSGDTNVEQLKRAKEENRRLLSILEDKDFKIITLEKRIYQMEHDNSMEIERLREENATLMRAMAALKSN